MDMPSAPPVTGLLLAAGRGVRMGQPKAVVEIEGRTLTEIAADALLSGGCRDVLVVLGAEAQRVRARLAVRTSGWGTRVVTTECAHWADGLSASLRTGLAVAAARGRTCPSAVLIHLVDLPDVGAGVVARVLDAGRSEASWTQVLVRATYDGSVGHPALIGQRHWQGVMDTARGDRGAGKYLRVQQAAPIECGDLAVGRDVDTQGELTAYLGGWDGVPPHGEESRAAD